MQEKNKPDIIFFFKTFLILKIGNNEIKNLSNRTNILQNITYACYEVLFTSFIMAMPVQCRSIQPVNTNSMIARKSIFILPKCNAYYAKKCHKQILCYLILCQVKMGLQN